MRNVVAMVLVCLFSLPVGGQQGDERVRQLEALTPADPMGYFELAESIAYEQPDAASQVLARHLFILALELDRRAAVPTGLSSSVCFALADLSFDASEREWLIALAESLVRQSQRVSWQPADSLGNPEDALRRFALLEAIAQHRDGHARDAIQQAQEPETARILGRYAEVIPGGVEGFVEGLGLNTACRECRNRRVSRDARGVYRVCLTCAGDPGLTLRRVELIEGLRLEAAMLDAQPGTWAGDLLLRGDAPMRTLRVEELAGWFGVDSLKTVFRGGVWVSMEESGVALDPAGEGE